MKNYIIQDDTDLNVFSLPFQLPLHALYASKDTYVNYPSFQRQEVWPDKFKFELIDSLVRGAYVPDILVTDRTDGQEGMWVLDGQQRLQTMMHFMAALEADINHQPIPHDEHGLPYFYFRLTKKQDDRLRRCMIKFSKLQGVAGDMLSTTFLRLQNQVALSSAEKLWASPSRFRNIAATVHEHPFYKQIYTGRTTRRQTFQMSIYPVVIEMYKPFADMNNNRLRQLTEGARSELLYDGMEQTILKNMDLVTKLYDGVHTSSMIEMVAMYQSVWLLNFIEADLEGTSPGALAPWYQQVVVSHRQNAASSTLTRSAFARMGSYKMQRQMWTKWLDEIVYGNFISLGDSERERRTLAQLQRVTGWLKNNGICRSCGNPHVRLLDIERHVFRAADERSSYNNCTSNVKQLFSVAVNG